MKKLPDYVNISSMNNVRMQSYINQFSQLFDGEPWLDETFAKKLDKLTEAQVFAQPSGNNHCVAEVVSHIIEWRKEVIRRVSENSSGRKLSMESYENWRPYLELKQIGWPVLYNNLKQSQQQLLAFLQKKEDNFLDEQLMQSKENKEYSIAGLLHHDVYHLGQIGLILKLTGK